MKFEYKKTNVIPAPGFESGELYQTKIPIVLVGPTGNLRFEALVDTGSDQTIFPRTDVKEITGIVIDKNLKSEVKGRLEHHNESLYFAHNTKLQISKDQEIYEFPAPIWFSDEENSPAILGHSGFLEYFTITFDGENHELTLEPNKNFPGTSKKLAW
ncbi:MAG: hypothetical protein AAB649_04495 [Patescibacteria group bacterium]